MQLLDSDIKTREVLDWQGIHLLHFRFSSCSQKTRIFLNLKNIDWQSHHLNLASQENYENWFLGINPRGLVPVLVHNGAVHIESNDILQYLEETFPEVPLMPEDLKEEIGNGLKEEDDLHMAIRAITMRYLSPKNLVKKKEYLLENYASNDGTVGGEPDSHKEAELTFWRDFGEQGVTDEQAMDAVSRFHHVFRQFDQRLADQPYLLGRELTLLDIAWFIYTVRLKMAGYPLAALHPNLHRWFMTLSIHPAFAGEVTQPLPMRFAIGLMQFWQRVTGNSLKQMMQRHQIGIEKE